MKSITSDIFAFIRELPNYETYAIVTNSGSSQIVDLSIFINLPDTLEIVASSKDSAHRIGYIYLFNSHTYIIIELLYVIFINFLYCIWRFLKFDANKSL